MSMFRSESSSRKLESNRFLDEQLKFVVGIFLIETKIYSRICKRTEVRSIDFETTLKNHQVDCSRRSFSSSSRTKLSIEWLSIDGEQPKINEKGKFEPVDRSTKNHFVVKSIFPREISTKLFQIGHELTVEQQNFFRLLTERSFSGEQTERTESFRRLSTDGALQPVLPRIFLFLQRGIETNLFLADFRFVIRFLSILKMLTINSNLSFHEHFHFLLPTLILCLVCRIDFNKHQRLLDDRTNNLWILRQKSAEILIDFHRNFQFFRKLENRIENFLRHFLTSKQIQRTFSTVFAALTTFVAIADDQHKNFAQNLIEHFKNSTDVESDFDFYFDEQRNIFLTKIQQIKFQRSNQIETIEKNDTNKLSSVV